MPNERSVESVTELEAKLREYPVVFLTDYRGLTVTDLANLRRQLRAAGVDYRVAKNTLLGIAAQHIGLTGLEPYLAGPTAVALAPGNEIAVAKALTDFARVSRILTIKGGVVGKHAVTGADVEELAMLPGEEQVHANLVGSVQGPLANLASLLTNALSGIVYALDQREQQLQPAG
ncbi:MAG: 50S ribosomal protein L10 [Chloroflexota bacterium]